MLSDFKRIDGPWSWIMCCLTLLSSLLQYGGICTYGILFPNILKEFQSGRAITAIPGSLGIANTGVLTVITGKLCDVLGIHRMMLFGGALCATGLIASSFVKNIYALIATFGFLLGFGCSAVYVCSMLGVHLYFQKYRFEAISLVNVGPSSALLIVSPIVEKLNEAFGWRKAMLLLASFSIVPCLVGLLMRSKPLDLEEERVNVTDSDQIHCNGRELHKCHCKLSNIIYCSAFSIKIYTLTTVMTTAVCLGHSMPFVHLAKFCDDIGFSSELSSWLYFTIGLSSTISRALVGKFGKSVPLSLPQIFQVGCFILMLGNLYLPSVSKYYALVLYCIGYGCGEGLLFAPCMNIIMDCLPSHRRGSGFGIFQFFISSAYVVGPIISGLIADATGSYSYAFYIAASLEIFAGILGLLTRFIPLEPQDNQNAKELEEELVIERETVL